MLATLLSSEKKALKKALKASDFICIGRHCRHYNAHIAYVIIIIIIIS